MCAWLNAAIVSASRLNRRTASGFPESSGQEFERHLAMQAEVLRFINHAHPSGAQLPGDPVVADLLSLHRPVAGYPDGGEIARFLGVLSVSSHCVRGSPL